MALEKIVPGFSRSQKKKLFYKCMIKKPRNFNKNE